MSGVCQSSPPSARGSCLPRNDTTGRVVTSDGMLGAVTSNSSYTSHMAQLLRTDVWPFWTRLRHLLEQQGVDPQSAMLAESFEDGGGPNGSGQEFGIVVTTQEQVFEFVVDIEEGDDRYENAVLREWNDKTDDWQSRPFSKHVREAISVLRCGEVTCPPTPGEGRPKQAVA